MYEYGPNAIGNAHHTRRRRTSYSQAGQGQYAGHTSRTQENKRGEKARRRGKGAPSRQGGAVEAEGGALEASHRSTPYYSILTRGREAVYVILPCTVPVPLFVPLVQWYQRYRVPPWLEQNTTDPLVPFGWAVSEHCPESPLKTNRS
jgi:hypothetical protein